MRVFFATVCLLALTIPLSAAAQSDWGNLDSLIMPELTTSGTAEASYWLPDAATPEAATEAIAVVYEYIPGSAGNTSIALGHFSKDPDSFTYTGPLNEVYGQNPRDVAFLPDRIELTTTTLRDSDARCCPSGTTRWSIDRRTRMGTKLAVD